MRFTRVSMVLGSLLAGSVSCDKLTGGGDGSNDGDKAKSIEEGARAEAEEAVDELQGKDDKDEDKGTVSLEIGDTQWEASRATFKHRDNGMTISASAMQFKNKKAKRQELKLYLPEFKGPGEYQLNSPSMFLGVGLDTDKLEKAEGDDEKQTDVAVEAVNKSQTIMIMGGTATITEADDDHIDGTFEWNPPPQLKKPNLAGKFHAVKPKPRKKRKKK